MRYKVGIGVLALSLAVLPGCSWDMVRRGMLGSLYSSFGDGHSHDRLSDFDQRYEQQSRAAEEYYRQHQQPL